MTPDRSSEPAAPPLPGAWSSMASHLARRFGRRRLLLGLAASSLSLASVRIFTRAHGSEETFAVQAGASPDASPPGSPVASPPPATPSPTGALEVIHDQRPVYDQAPEASQELRLLVAGTSNDNFIPAAYLQDPQIPVSYLDPLLWIDEVTMEPKPWLAASWKWSGDGKVITYSLRTDVNWHDGEPLTARDVVFSCFVYRDDINSAFRNIFASMDNAEAIDDRTVRVTLNAPDGGWLFNASSQLIFQRKQYTDYWRARPEGDRTLTGFKWGKKQPLGTGPWQIRERSKRSVRFARNDGYWAGPAHFEELTISWEADAAKRLAAWSRGETDLLWLAKAADIPTVNSSHARLYIADAASVMFAAFNFKNPKREGAALFADRRVRQALSLAIDRQRYAHEVFQNFVQETMAGTVAQPWAHDPTSLNPDRDLQQAKELLKQAGWEQPVKGAALQDAAGNRFEIEAIVPNDARPALISVLRSAAGDLKDAGIKLVVRPLAPDRFRDRWTTTFDYDLIAYAYNLYPGFTDFDLYGSGWDIRVNPQGWNPGGYRNGEVDKAIRAILVEEDSERQKAALGRLQRAANDDLFGLWFGFPQDLIVVQPDVLGFQPNKQWQTWDTRKLWRTTSTQPSALSRLPSAPRGQGQADDAAGRWTEGR